MSNSPEIRDIKRRNSRKRAELSLSISLVGVIMLLTPLVNTFTVQEGNPTVFALLIYLFSIWGFLIITCAIISHYLAKDTEQD